VSEEPSKNWFGGDWDGHYEPLIDAARAAVSAAAIDNPRISVRVTWEDRIGTYDSLNEAEARLAHANSAKGLLITIQHAPDGEPAHFQISGRDVGWNTAVQTSGSQWDVVVRAHEAAVKVLSATYPSGDQTSAETTKPPDDLARAPSAAQPSPEVPASKSDGGWLSNPVIIAAIITAVAAVLIAVLTGLLS
jgi:hypothetical protein